MRIRWTKLFIKPEPYGKNYYIALLFCFPVALSAQTYQQLSEKAIECIEKDSFHRAEELLLQALKLEPKNAKNALLFFQSGLGAASSGRV